MLELPPPEDDGLIIPEVGEWSHDKHHFLRRYVDAFTTAMRGKRWHGLHYLDLFAGPGIERLEKSKRLEWGSPLVAAQARYPFTGLHYCELSAEKYEALEARLARLKPRSAVQMLPGDANQCVREIVQGIPDQSLSLAFLDPYGLHLQFDTLRVLAEKRADLIIFFPDRLDILRNAATYYFDNPDSNLDRVLGTAADWRHVWDQTPESRRAAAVRDLYVEQIRGLGYAHFDYEPVPNSGARLYWLIFASRSPVGVRIWRHIAQKKPDGQMGMDFDEPRPQG